MQEDAIESRAKLFQSLSSDARLRILFMLLKTDKPVHIKGVARALKLDYAVTYRHIENLREAKLVNIYEVGRSRVPYVLDKAHLQALFDAADKLL
jgi:DNA-binding transcriptional ArsR family regulator